MKQSLQIKVIFLFQKIAKLYESIIKSEHRKSEKWTKDSEQCSDTVNSEQRQRNIDININLKWHQV